MHASESDAHRLEDALRGLQATVEQLTRRVDALEGRVHLALPAGPNAAEAGPSDTPPAATGPPVADPAPTAPPVADLAATAPSVAGPPGPGLPMLIGRTSMAFGGAFLLRALTESGAVSEAVGVALGLAYAAIWVLLSARAGRLGGRLDAALHGIAASAIASPLLFEATTRFDALPPALSAGLIALFGGALFASAWRWRLRALAWVALPVAMLTAAGLMLRTGAATPFLVVLLGFTAAALVVTWQRGWTPLRWTVTLGVDALVIGATGAYLADPTSLALPPAALLVLQASVALLGLAALAYLALARGRALPPFEAAQAALGVLVVLEGSSRALASVGVDPLGLWVGALVLAAGCFGLAAWRWRSEHGSNLACYVGLATLLVIRGLAGVAPAWAAEVGWGVIALLAIGLTRHSARGALRVSAALLVGVVAGSSGLVRAVAVGLGIGGGAAMAPMSARALGALGLACAGYALMRARAGADRADWRWSGPGFAVALVAAWGLGAALALTLAPLVAGAPPARLDAGALAALRTTVLAALVWLLAWLGRSGGRPELRWAAFTTLGYAGLKVVLEDLPRGRPTTLFVTFVLIGATLMILPRLVRRPALSAAPSEVAAGPGPVAATTGEAAVPPAR